MTATVQAVQHLASYYDVEAERRRDPPGRRRELCIVMSWDSARWLRA